MRDQLCKPALETLLRSVRAGIGLGLPIGIILSHGYTQLAVDDRAPYLKGSDAELYQMLTTADLGGAHVHLRPVVYSRHMTNDGREEDDRREEYPYDRIFSWTRVHSFTAADVAALAAGRAPPVPTYRCRRRVRRSGSVSSGAGSASGGGSSAAAASAGEEEKEEDEDEDEEVELPLPNDIRFFVGNTDNLLALRTHKVEHTYGGNEFLVEVSEQEYFSGAIIIIPPGAGTAAR